MMDGSLQKAIFAALEAGNVAEGRIYDRVPTDPAPTFPYVTIGDEQVIDDSNSCDVAYEIFSDVHVWSRPDSGSKLELKSLIKSVVDRLAVQLAVDGFVVAAGMLETSRSFRDQDGLTEHGVLTFRYLVDPA